MKLAKTRMVHLESIMKLNVKIQLVNAFGEKLSTMTTMEIKLKINLLNAVTHVPMRIQELLAQLQLKIRK